mmetsp:Transcript_2649/g.4926  ORF Transcript_2649/g.4926 Transcript_2649/m.4926 type:complete len:263 (-) Transcript_2649:303-1091(-)
MAYHRLWTASSPLSTLPAEILARVFSHLSDTEILLALQVCKSWASLVHNGELWRELSTIQLHDWQIPRRPRQSISKLYFEQRKRLRERLRTKHELLFVELAGSRNLFAASCRRGPAPLRVDSVGGMRRALRGFGAHLDVNHLSETSGVSILHVAAKCGAARCVGDLIDHWPVDIELRAMDHSGFTPLQEAAYAGHLGAVRAFLKRGARKDLQNEPSIRRVRSKIDSGKHGPFNAEQWARLKGHEEVAAAISNFRRARKKATD